MERVLLSAANHLDQHRGQSRARVRCFAYWVIFLKLPIFSSFSHNLGCAEGNRRRLLASLCRILKLVRAILVECIIQAGDVEEGSLFQGIFNAVCFPVHPHQGILAFFDLQRKGFRLVIKEDKFLQRQTTKRDQLLIKGHLRLYSVAVAQAFCNFFYLQPCAPEKLTLKNVRGCLACMHVWAPACMLHSQGSQKRC